MSRLIAAVVVMAVMGWSTGAFACANGAKADGKGQSSSKPKS